MVSKSRRCCGGWLIAAGVVNMMMMMMIIMNVGGGILVMSFTPQLSPTLIQQLRYNPPSFNKHFLARCRLLQHHPVKSKTRNDDDITLSSTTNRSSDHHHHPVVVVVDMQQQARNDKNHANMSLNTLQQRRFVMLTKWTLVQVLLLVSTAFPIPAVVDGGVVVANAIPNSSSSDGASSAANAKLTTGGASTLQSGRTISITRGVNLDNSNFANQNLKGVAFQQSVVRDTDFSNSILVGASFFDATLDGSNFNNADMTNANIEMAQLNRASMQNTIARDMYVSGATLFTGITTIENSDWTDTYLRADQQKYLCQHPTAKGTNPITGVNTRESLLCKD